MVDKELVQSFILQLHDKLKLLRQKPIASLEDLQKDPFLQNALLHLLQTSIEICLDAANHIIADENWRTPTSNRDAFQILFEQNILSKELLQKCQNMASFRNIVVRMYDKIDLEEIYVILKSRLKNFEEYSQAISKHIL